MKSFFLALSLCSTFSWQAIASEHQPPQKPSPIFPSLKDKINAITLEREQRHVPKSNIHTSKHRKKRGTRTVKAGSTLKIPTALCHSSSSESDLISPAVSSQNDLNLGGIPAEIWYHIFSFVTKNISKESSKEKGQLLQCRLVCKGFKEIIDGGTVYALSLQAPAHLTQAIKFYEGKKFSLSGWVPKLSSLQERLPLNLDVRYGKVYISQWDDVDTEQPLYKALTITLTVPTEEDIPQAQELFNTRGLTVTVRARETLWAAFDTTLKEENSTDRAIKHNKETFLPLMDLPNHEKIIRRIFEKGATEFRDTSEILAQIEDPTERTHIASLLSKKILTNCPSISPLTFVITALAQVQNLEDRNQIASYLSPRVLEKSKGVMGLATVIQSFSDIKTSPKRIKVASLLTDEVVSVCRNGMDLAPVIKTLGDLEEETLLPSLRISSDLLQDCSDGRKLAETIKKSPRPLIPSGHFQNEEAVF